MWDSPFAQEAARDARRAWDGAPKDHTVSRRRRMLSVGEAGTARAGEVAGGASAAPAAAAAGGAAVSDNVTSSTWTAAALNQAFGRRAADAYPLYLMNRTDATEKYARLVRGSEVYRARFTMDEFPIPRYKDNIISLYQLQERSRTNTL